MSWKGTSFVKEQAAAINGEPLTIPEKFVWLTLADYHNTAKGAAFPSVPVLSVDCLMSERSCYRVLGELERKLCLVRRRNGTGRGCKTEYLFVGLDVSQEQAQTWREVAEKGCQPVTLCISERVTEERRKTATNTAKNSDTNCSHPTGNKEKQNYNRFLLTGTEPHSLKSQSARSEVDQFKDEMPTDTFVGGARDAS
jgi:hypothetical protein